MRELSLNVMDVAQNSISAGATLTEILVTERRGYNYLEITIRDNGKGMTPEQVEQVTDPFYTTRTTRKVGLGVPFFKMSSEMTGGSFSIHSIPGKGTTVAAHYHTNHIDMTPIGDMNETVLLLVIGNPDIDFFYQHTLDDKEFTLDTRELREILGEVSFNEPEITQWIREYLAEHEAALREP